MTIDIIYTYVYTIHLTCIISYAKVNNDASTKVVNEEGSSNEMAFLRRIGVVEAMIRIIKEMKKSRSSFLERHECRMIIENKNERNV